CGCRVLPTCFSDGRGGPVRLKVRHWQRPAWAASPVWILQGPAAPFLRHLGPARILTSHSGSNTKSAKESRKGAKALRSNSNVERDVTWLGKQISFWRFFAPSRLCVRKFGCQSILENIFQLFLLAFFRAAVDFVLVGDDATEQG